MRCLQSDLKRLPRGDRASCNVQQAAGNTKHVRLKTGDPQRTPGGSIAPEVKVKQDQLISSESSILHRKQIETKSQYSQESIF